MPHPTLQRLFFTWQAVVAMSALVAAPAAAVEPAAAARVREIGPEIYYMENDAGRLVPVPGFRYEDFVELLRLREGLPGIPQPPGAVLETLAVRAEPPPSPPAGVVARRRATVQLTVRQTRSGWTAVPVALNGLWLTEPPRYEGDGRMLLAAEAGDGAGGEDVDSGSGYRLWLTGTAGRGSAELRHAVILVGELPVDLGPRQETITLHLPRATASRVELETTLADPEVSVTPAAVPPSVGVLPEGTGSLVTLVGLAGTSRIRMQSPTAGTGAETGLRPAAVPQVMVESLIRIDGRSAVTEATLELEDLPASVSTIRIRLPPRTTLRSVRSPAALVSVEGTAAAPEAVVRIDASPRGPRRVDVECERPVDPSGREVFEPLAFTVADVPLWRQWGRASLVVEGDWQLEWADPAGCRRIDPPPSARRTGFVAAFAFDSQPASLPLRVRPRGSRVVVEPEYRYDVSATRIALEARLRVSVRGAPVSRMSLLLEGWEVDDVGPASVVDAGGVSAEQGRLVIPFLQPIAGDAVVEVRATLPIATDAGRVSWKLPQPQADLVGPAAVYITPRSDIELLPDAAAVRGLVRQLSPPVARSEGDRNTLAYRLDGAEGSFAAARRFLPRHVDAVVVAQADFDASEAVVRETIRLTVAHVPLEFVSLSVPESVMRSGTLEVRQDGLLLSPEEDRAAEQSDGERGADGSESSAGTAPTPTSLRALLAAPLLGSGEITVQYAIPIPAPMPESTRAEDLPLVLPMAAHIDKQTIALAVPDTLTIDVRGDGWKPDIGSFASSATRTWATARALDSVPLAIAARKRSPLGDTLVEAAWLQTRVMSGRREDRYRYRLHGTVDRITLGMPPDLVTVGADAAVVEVRLDGRPLPDAARVDGRWVVDLPQPNGRDGWLLEVIASRRLETAFAAPRVVDLVPPVFPVGTLQRRFYWELLAEPDEHLLGWPRHWTSQQQWEWGSFGLRQVPLVSHAALERWLMAGAVASDSDAGPPTAIADIGLPAMGSRVVYAGAGPAESGRIWLIPTWLIVLVVSGPVLAAGLAVVYWPPLRAPPILLTVAALVCLAAAAAPGVAPLVIQAAIPGLLLSGLAGALQIAVRGHAVGPPSPRPVAAALASASSLTQVAAIPSLIIAPSVSRSPEGGGSTGVDRP